MRPAGPGRFGGGETVDYLGGSTAELKIDSAATGGDYGVVVYKPLTFLLDSGLQDEQGAAFAAPPETLTAAGIRIPQTTEDVRESGAGHVPLQVARFPIRRLGLGSLVQNDLVGFYGVFADVWREAAGFPIHGIVSHGFLRRYSWTLDFESMMMTFVPPADSSETGATSSVRRALLARPASARYFLFQEGGLRRARRGEVAG